MRMFAVAETGPIRLGRTEPNHEQMVCASAYICIMHPLAEETRHNVEMDLVDTDDGYTG